MSQPNVGGGGFLLVGSSNAVRSATALREEAILSTLYRLAIGSLNLKLSLP